jgi:hypothetical protein
VADSNCDPRMQARREWLARQQPVHVQHPLPEVRARQAAPDEIPRGAGTIAKVAERCKWTVKVTYARGTSLTAGGKPGKVVDSVLVRMVRTDGDGYAHAVATWVDGKFDLAYVGRPHELARKVGAKELRVFLEATVDDGET